MYDFQCFLRAPRNSGRVPVAAHQHEKMLLLFAYVSSRTFDLDKSRSAVKPTIEQVRKPLRQALHAPKMDKDVLMERRIIDSLALPEITGIGAENDAVWGQRDANLILDVGFR